jgi:probable sporulation protein (polysaccharide deacetylase family)
LTENFSAVPEPIRQGGDNKEIALCCNVFWGEEYLPEMLKILDEENVRLTFFIGGTWAEENPAMLKDIAARGHELGNHSFNHPHVNNLSKEKNQEQILKTEQIIEEICSVKTAFYAPPYGEYNETVLKAAAELNYPTILWSIDTVDWKRPPPELIKNRVIKKLHNGAIVLMHPTEPTAKALREMIREIKSQGYEIKRLSEILEGEK